MAKYTVSATVTVSIYTNVEADSPEEALKEAEGRDMQSFCYRCTGGDEVADESWSLTGGLDGEAQNLSVDDTNA